MKPSRIRVLDLPFTAVEWVLPEEISPAQYLGQDKWIVWERSPLARERSLFGYWDDTDNGQLPGAAYDGAAQGPDDRHPNSSGEPLWKRGARQLRFSTRLCITPCVWTPADTSAKHPCTSVVRGLGKGCGMACDLTPLTR